MAQPYSFEDRARTRHIVKSINALEEEARKAITKGEALKEASEEQVRALLAGNYTTDLNGQINALTSIGERLQNQHLSRLYPLAQDDFNAFCEVMIPDEPPSSPWHMWLTAKLQEIENDPTLSRFILNCPPGHAKPLSKLTPILMADGSMKPLGDIVVGDMVISHLGRACKVTEVHDQGRLHMVRVTTRAGRVIDSALDHPFLIARSPDQWRVAAELRPGDPLQIVGGRWADNAGARLDPDLVELCAWWQAYGSVQFVKRKDGHRGFSNSSMWLKPDRARLLLDLLKKMGRRCAVAPARAVDGVNVRLPTKDHRDISAMLGLDTPAAERRVPDMIMTGGRLHTIAYLSRFLTERAEAPARFKKPRLVVYGRSLPFMHDLQHLCARLGVQSEVILPDRDFGGRPCLEITTAGIAALHAIGWTYDGYRADVINAVEPAGPAAEQLAGVALDVADPVHMIEAIGDMDCACLTVEPDHSFVAAGVAVKNSTYASRLYVVWRMGRNPNLQVIGGGHGQTFVENEFSSKNRSLVGTPAFQKVFPGVLIDHSARAKGQWKIAGTKGQYVAKGVGQGVHGFRANFIVVDDPYSKIEDAESPTIREKVNTWFLTDIGTRLLPGGKIFVIMTRFHEEDLTGKLLELNKVFPADKKYMHIAVPAICFDPDTDLLGRRLGEVLWDFYPLTEFVDKKISLKFQRFALVYQQLADAASDDAITGKFKFWENLPHRTDDALSEARSNGLVDRETGKVLVDRAKYFRRVVVSVDTATKDNERADWTVIQVWGETHDQKHYLFDQERVKVEFPMLVEKIERMARRHKADFILVEDKGNGTSYAQHRGEQAYQKRRAPAPVVAIKVDSRQGKSMRFDEVTPFIEAGEVYLPANADWMDLFLREVGQFPDGNNDDQVDAMTQYLRWAKTKRTRFGAKKVSSHG